MAFKRIQLMEIWEILRRWHDGQPIRTISSVVGCDRAVPLHLTERPSRTVISFLSMQMLKVFIARHDLISTVFELLKHILF
jgi:hypothetical protein